MTINSRKILDLLTADQLDLIDDNKEALELMRERTVKNYLRLIEIYLETPADKRAEFLEREHIGEDILKRAKTGAVGFIRLVRSGKSEDEAIRILGQGVFLN